MDVMNMLLRIFSAELGIPVSVIIVRVLNITHRSHLCFLNLEDSATALLVDGFASTIM